MNIFRRLHSRAGFTLIELLVVISIIALLASIVIAATNAARGKGKDSHIIGDVQQTRLALQLGLGSTVYSDLYNSSANATNVAGSLTVNGPDFSGLASIATDAAAQGSAVTFRVNTNGTAGNATTPNVTSYAVYAQLISAPGSYFCLDSNGRSSQGTSTNLYSACN